MDLQPGPQGEEDQTPAMVRPFPPCVLDACVLLHSMGFQPQHIKWIRRWLSDAFVYRRPSPGSHIPKLGRFLFSLCSYYYLFLLV